MGFTTYDSIINALTVLSKGQRLDWWKSPILVSVVGSYHSLWIAPGKPSAGAYGAALTARKIDNATAGTLSFVNPTAPATSHLLRAGAGCSSNAITGALFLADRLLDYAGVDHSLNTLQSMIGTDVLTRYANGAGVLPIMEVSTVLGATPQDVTLTYTNQDGSTGRVGVTTIIVSSAVSRVPHSPMFLNLQAGDTGVRSIQSVQFSAVNSGISTVALVRPFFYIPLIAVGIWTERDLVLQIPNLPQLQDNHALAWYWQMGAGVSNPIFQGEIASAEN